MNLNQKANLAKASRAFKKMNRGREGLSQCNPTHSISPMKTTPRVMLTGNDHATFTVRQCSTEITLGERSCYCVSPLFLAATVRGQQDITLTLYTLHVYSGVNYSGVHSNGLTPSTTNGTDPVCLIALGKPPGVTIKFSTNVLYPSDPTIMYRSNLLMYICVTNAPAEDYSLTVQAYVIGVGTNNASFTLHIGELLSWRAEDPDNVGWSVSSNWGPAVTPIDGTNVKFEDNGTATNYLEGSLTLGRLSYVRFANNQIRESIIAPGATLLVTNRFIVNIESEGVSKTLRVNFVGTNGATLAVSNALSDCSFHCFNGGVGGSINMSRLDNFYVEANRFGFLDVTLITEGSVGVQGMGESFMARTNVIVAHYAAPFTADHFTNSIQIWNNDQQFNNGSSVFLNLGLSNAFLADSIMFGKNRVAGANTTVRFNSALTYTTNIVGGITNVITNKCFAYFRNIDGGRMSFFWLGVDSGANAVSSGSGAQADFSLGKLDLMADTMWLGRNRVNSTVNA